MHKILIVEDEPAMQIGLRDNLEFDGYDTDLASDGEEGLNKILNNDYSLIILDVMMPKLSGFDVCKKAREANIKTPIILLTAKSEEIDKVLGLEFGADDYITKPFSIRELMARIKAVIRRIDRSSETQQDSLTKLAIGRLNVDFQSYTASKDNQEIKMTHKEFEILKFLLSRANRIVTRDSIIQHVWEDDYQPTSRTVDNFILKLRQKVEVDSNKPKIILTIHGVGYKLIK